MHRPQSLQWSRSMPIMFPFLSKIIASSGQTGQQRLQFMQFSLMNFSFLGIQFPVLYCSELPVSSTVPPPHSRVCHLANLFISFLLILVWSYFATFSNRFSLITATFTSPGYSQSFSIFLAMSNESFSDA